MLNLKTLFAAGFLLSGQMLFAQTVMHAGVVDGADLLVAGRVSNFNQSAFAKAMKEQQPEEMKALTREKQAKFTAATGLEEEDLETMIASVKISDLDLENMGPDQADKVQAVLALQLKKAITLDQLEAGMKVMQEDAPGASTLSRATLGGTDVVEIKPTNDMGTGSFYAGLSPDGQTVIVTMNEGSMTSALERVAAGRGGAPNPAMGQAMQALANQQLQLALVLPDNVKQGMRAAMQGGGNMGPMGAFMNTQSLLLGATADEKLDLKLMLDVGDAAAAQMLGQNAPMMMMMVPGAAQMGEKLKFGSEGNVFQLNVSLSPEDMQPDLNGMQQMQGF